MSREELEDNLSAAIHTIDARDDNGTYWAFINKDFGLIKK